MKVKLLVEGGAMKPGPALSQKIGPLGINIGEIISKVNEATSSFKGLKVPVELDIDAKTKSFEINVFSPPVSELLKKELKIEKASGKSKEIKVGNLAIEQVIKVAKTKHSKMLSDNFKNNVKSIVGSCVSLGSLIENKEPKEIEEEISQGKYDKQINEQKTEVTPEKRKKLDTFFKEVEAEQAEKIKKQEEEAVAAEAKKAEAVEGEAPVEGEEKKEEAPTEADEKPEEKSEEKKDK